MVSTAQCSSESWSINLPNQLILRRLIYGDQGSGDGRTHSVLKDVYLDPKAVKTLQMLRAFVKID